VCFHGPGISAVREKVLWWNRLETDENNYNFTEGNSAIIFGGFRRTTTGLAKQGVPVSVAQPLRVVYQ